MHECCGLELTHNHTSFSLLDGLQTPEEAAARAKEIGQRYLVVTDHGMMAAIPRQIRACEEHGLEALFGVELYCNPIQPKLETADERKRYVASLNEEDRDRWKKSHHLLAIAFNETGYRNLVRLCSWGHLYGTGGRPTRPRVNNEILESHKEGIFFTSCCYASEIGYTFDRFGEDAAFDKVAEYAARYGENFWLEIMMLDFVKQKPYDRFILRAHDRFGIPLLLTTDSHYSRPEDSHYQRLMLMIQTKKTLAQIEQLKAADDTKDLFELQDENLWMKSEDELNTMWEAKYSDVIDYELFKQAKRNTVTLCDRARGVKLDRSMKLPSLPDAEDKLKDFAVTGLVERGVPVEQALRYRDRLKEELELINHKGFASYFLIQKMIVDEARRYCKEVLGYDESEAVNPGRGSGVASLVFYALGVTDIDPVKHDLLFSRFLSPARGGRSLRLRFNGLEPIS